MARDVDEDSLDLLLDRVIDRDIALGLVAPRHAGAQEAGMLAGTVVVKGGRLRAGGRQCKPSVLAERPVDAAFEIAFAQAGLLQHAPRGRDMLGLAIMRRAGQRDLGVRETEFIGRAAFDHHQGLHRLDRGARKAWQIDIAHRHHDRAVGVGHGKGAVVNAFDAVAAGHFDKDGIAHLRIAAIRTRCH